MKVRPETAKLLQILRSLQWSPKQSNPMIDAVRQWQEAGSPDAPSDSSAEWQHVGILAMNLMHKLEEGRESPPEMAHEAATKIVDALAVLDQGLTLVTYSGAAPVPVAIHVLDMLLRHAAAIAVSSLCDAESHPAPHIVRDASSATLEAYMDMMQHLNKEAGK